MKISPSTGRHLEALESFYDKAPTESTAAGKAYRRFLARYYRLLIPPDASVLEVGCGAGELLELLPNEDVWGVDVSENQLAAARRRVPRGNFLRMAGENLSLDRKFDCIILSETANQAADVQAMLERLHSVATPDTRLVINFYNTLWRPALSAATTLGFRGKTPAANWLNISDLENLLELAGWQKICAQARVLCPLPAPLVAGFANRFLAPFLPGLCLSRFCVARPRAALPPEQKLKATVVVPARNESGNMSDVVDRIPEMGAGTEIIFIEGNSTDDTWDRVRELPARYPHRHVVTMQQTGKGKGNAVREAFAAATGDVLIILDADLTVSPEDLPKFFDVVASGQAEFANGVRLVYPMESEAMRFLNLCANHSFAVVFSWLLGQKVKDTLCGTKVLTRANYEKIAAARSYFGDFDPFGDFDLLFGATRLQLEIRDIPVRYQNRVYGETNIQRWRHGLLLIRMVLFAARKLKFL